MKKLLALSVFILLLGASVIAHAADWTDSMQTAIQNSDYNQVSAIAASHPGDQGAIAMYLLQQSQQFPKDHAREVRLFAAATPYVGRIQSSDAANASAIISAQVKFVSDKDFQKTHPRETTDIFLSALNMSSQQNIAAGTPGLHADVLAAADDFTKTHPQGADKRLLEQTSMAQTGGAPQPSPAGAASPTPDANAANWTDSLHTALANSDYNQVNVIGASHPREQGAIATYILQQSQQYQNDRAREVRIFVAAAPFVGRIPPVDVAAASDIVTTMLKIAADKDFQVAHPREASGIFLAALNMSSQPNFTANDPNLHGEVLEAADDFTKAHPQDADKKLLEEVSLAEAGGAPESTPRGVINPTPEAFTPSITDSVHAAIANGNFNQINVIAASHPGQQGAIAIYLLQQSQTYGSEPVREVRIFAAATPFVGRIPPSDAGTASDVIGAMLKLADDKDFQIKHPREAANIFLNALNMSGQPNIVAYDPNLHAEVLEAANDFLKDHPQDADKKLKEEVDLAEAGGAPESTPRGVIQPIPHGNQPPTPNNPCANNPSCE